MPAKFPSIPRQPFTRIPALWLGGLLLYLVAMWAAPAQGAVDQGVEPTPDALALYEPGRLVVKLRAPAAPASAAPVAPDPWARLSQDPTLAALTRRFAVTSAEPAFPTSTNPRVRALGLDRVLVLTMPSAIDAWSMAAAFAAAPGVEYAEPVLLARAAGAAVTATPNDPLYPQQYGPPQINLPAAWDLATGNPGLTIALLDTGVDYTHPDLAANVNTTADFDFVDGDADAMDGDGHGTAVASLAAAAGNNGLGMAGACWGCSLLPIRVGGESIVPGLPPVIHFGSLSVAQGIYYATVRGADIISMSLGGQCSSLWADVVNLAYESGVTLVAAAGNIVPFVAYPAKHERVIAVSATNATGGYDNFSSYGPEVDVAAPGIDVLLATPGNGFTTGSGTSYATPLVAGTAALMLQRNPNLDNAALRQILRDTATDLGDPGFDPLYGYGRINSGAAVAQATAPPPAPYQPPPATCGCVLSQVAATPSAEEDAQGSGLNTLRALRDEVLAQSASGRRLTRLYYKHSDQVASLLLNYPDLLARSLNVWRLSESTVTALLDNPAQVTLTRALVAEAEDLLAALSPHANAELRRDMWDAWNTIDPWSLVDLPLTDVRQRLRELP